MKINLITMEAEGTPQEIHELMELKKRIIRPEEPGQDIGPVRIEKVTWKNSRETRKRAAVNWQVADDLKAAGLDNTQIAQRLGCSVGTVYNHYAKEKAEE
jgi:DNA invertase Pin-like site-specific DNA recombinase